MASSLVALEMAFGMKVWQGEFPLEFTKLVSLCRYSDFKLVHGNHMFSAACRLLVNLHVLYRVWRVAAVHFIQ